MKTVTRTFTLYRFDELDTKIQESVLDFKLRTTLSANPNLLPNLSKNLPAIVEYVKKGLNGLFYFKNGNIANIPETGE